MNSNFSLFFFASVVDCHSVKYLPFGSKLFFLVHVMLGMGFPVAEHSRRTGEPFFTCKCPPDDTWSIVGGTENEERRN